MKTFFHGIGYIFVFWLVTWVWALMSPDSSFSDEYIRTWFAITMGFATSILFNHIEKI